MWRHIASNALSFFVVLLFLMSGVILWGTNNYDAEGPLSSAICLKVESGSNMSRVAGQLLNDGAIASESLFKISADYAERSDKLKAGSFLIQPKASIKSILQTVTEGGQSTCGTEIVYRIGVLRTTIQVRELDPATNRFEERVAFNPVEDAAPAIYQEKKAEADTRFRIAVAEGATSWQIVTSLRDLDVLEGNVAEIPAEGNLAPDSYEVRLGDTRGSVVSRMEAAQSRRLADSWANRVEGLPVKTPEEALILASLIEKETGVARERRQVASVFVNRLNKGMKLQTDPTVIYGITKGQGALGRGLRRSELRAETPWNTYVIPALPPTPIANPGLASIEAALNPSSTDYIFFVADGTGGHAFAVTLDEHNRNVAKWREIEAARDAN